MDEIERLIRETPLNERIDKAISMIGSMCAEGRCPKMSVPVRPVDEDIFITVTLWDAKSEIEALRNIIMNIRPGVTDLDIDKAIASFRK